MFLRVIPLQHVIASMFCALQNTGPALAGKLPEKGQITECLV